MASTSSVYGDAETYPTREDTSPRPVSPYGVTKVACEFLARTYSECFGLEVVVLRYFTVYGPRQRPDMAFARIISALLDRHPFPVYGTGEQSRLHVRGRCRRRHDRRNGRRPEHDRLQRRRGSETTLNGAIALCEEARARLGSYTSRLPGATSDERAPTRRSFARNSAGSHRPCSPKAWRRSWRRLAFRAGPSLERPENDGEDDGGANHRPRCRRGKFTTPRGHKLEEGKREAPRGNRRARRAAARSRLPHTGSPALSASFSSPV